MINTIPDITFHEYLSLFKDMIRGPFPDIDDRVIFFYDDSRVHQTKENKWVISADDIWDEKTTQLFIERLCDEKRSWIHLMGDGLLPDGSYLASIDYSKNLNNLKTHLNMGGNPIMRDGTAMRFTNIIVMPTSKPE